MSAPVIMLPVVHRPNFDCPHWREQFDRECAGDPCARVPHRTRPMLVVNNDRKRAEERAYLSAMLRLSAALNEPLIS